LVTILLRTVIIYVTLLIVMRLMGKRQIGELELSDLVTTFLISEIASLPITDTDIPILYAVIPMITLLAFEVFSSWFLSRFSIFKGLFSTRPATLIYNGKVNRREMLRARLSADELIGELRQKGISDISTVKYAILEQNGRLSVIQSSDFTPLCANDMNIAVKENGTDHIIISNGALDEHGMSLLELTEKDVEHILSSRRLKLKEIYLMLIDDGRNVKIFTKKE